MRHTRARTSYACATNLQCCGSRKSKALCFGSDIHVKEVSFCVALHPRVVHAAATTECRLHSLMRMCVLARYPDENTCSITFFSLRERDSVLMWYVIGWESGARTSYICLFSLEEMLILWWKIFFRWETKIEDLFGSHFWLTAVKIEKFWFFLTFRVHIARWFNGTIPERV